MSANGKWQFGEVLLPARKARLRLFRALALKTNTPMEAARVLARLRKVSASLSQSPAHHYPFRD
jgi:hypothetical protein